ncbi:alkaline phosphatase family protein [Candidatus Woesearchaeota archaeon]|nr:alkaline phosphatase family protein [Candidatus Woesearchaeota archaeon]
MSTQPLLGTSLEVISSVIRGLGGKTDHQDISLITNQVGSAQHTIFFLVDGLGYDSISKLPARSFLVQACQGKTRSIFPSATAAAITTLMTGLSPLEHGIPGWYTHFPHINEMGAILPSKTRAGKPLKLSRNAFPQSLLNAVPVRKNLVIKKNLAKSKFNSLFVKWDKTITFQNMGGMFRALRSAIAQSQTSPTRTFTYVYWGGYDDLSHLYGKQSEKARVMLQELDKRLEEFVKATKHSDTLLILTADHGQITTTRKNTILLNRDAHFVDCLRLPCAGEPRALFCYVRAERKQFFEKYVQQKYRTVLKIYKTSELLEHFGPGKMHPEFLQRTGDYVLIPKENCVLRFFLKGEEEVFFPGHHGGLSDEEMIVPLIVKKL